MSSQSRQYRINKRRLNYVLLLGLVLVLVLFFTMRKKRSRISDFKVELVHLPDSEGAPQDFIKEKDVKNTIQKSLDEKVDEQRAGDVDVRRIEQVLEELPMIENAEAFVDVSNILHVKITQRIPVIRVIDNNGLDYYLDKNGVKMPPSKYYSARVIIVTGAVAPYVADFLERPNYGLKSAFQLVQKLNSDPFFSTMVQQVYLDAGGEYTLIPILGDQKIRLGSLDDLDEKLQRLKDFYTEAMPYEGWKKYNSISVKYRGQIVCKKRG